MRRHFAHITVASALLSAVMVAGCGTGSGGGTDASDTREATVADGPGVDTLPGSDVTDVRDVTLDAPDACTTDTDGDGHRAMACGGDDCDDNNAAVHPGATEICDAAMVDEDCDGVANPASLCACSNTEIRSCPMPGACAAGTQTCANGAWGTCSIVPVTETCNGVDDNCNGTIDEGLIVSYYADCDADAHGQPTVTPIGSCAIPAGPPLMCPTGVTGMWATVGDDCDDTAAGTHPGAVEFCNSVDDNCNGTTDESCQASAPRQTAPLSTARVTRRQPLFHWALSPSATGAHVEICQDRACATVVTSFDATGSSGMPAANLSAGVLYWRIASLVGATVGTQWSSVWQFTVPVADGTVNTSWGTVPDFNGDGFADVVVAAPGGATPTLYVFAGSATGPGTTAASRIIEPNGPGSGFGANVASAGDVNGDGFADLIVGAPGWSANTGRSYVYLGGPTGLASTAAWVVSGTSGTNAYFGGAVSSAGDVNADGYADVVVGTWGASSGSGLADVYMGSTTGLSTTPATTRAGGGGEELGTAVAEAGDVNADGYGDVLIGAPANGVNGSGYAQLVGGGATGLGSFVVILTGPDGVGGRFGAAVAGAGDVNGDGLADVVVGAPCAPATAGGSCGAGRAHVYLGNTANPSTTPSWSASGPDGVGGRFGDAVAVTGDVGASGRGGILVGASLVATATGSAYFYAGNVSAAGVDAATSWSMAGPDGTGGRFASALASAGDVNGDGLADVLIGAYRVAVGADAMVGKAYVFNGRSVGAPPGMPSLGLTSSWSVSGPDATTTTTRSFGFSVASAAPRPQADRACERHRAWR